MSSLLGILTLAAAAVWMWRPIRYANDLWWHLATGRYIAQHHTLPRVDIFSWTAAGHTWINHEWLLQILLYFFYAAAGPMGITLWKILCVGLTQYLVWRRLARTLSVYWVWGGTAIIFWASRFGWNERADLASVLLLTWLASDIDQLARDEKIPGGWIRWPCLFALWANLHGGFILGIATSAVFILFSMSNWTRSFRMRVSLWWGLCGVATFVNPYGWTLHLSTLEGLRVLKSGFFTEWQASPWHPLELFWACLVFLGLSLLFETQKMRRVPWAKMATSLFLAWSAIKHVRNVPFFMTAAFPWALEAAARLVHEEWHTPPERVKAWRHQAFGLIGFATAVFLLVSLHDARTGVSRQNFPIDACEFIDQEKIMGPFYNQDGFGGYWIWRFFGQRPDFIDGRFHTVDGFMPLYRQIIDAQQGSPAGWQTFLENYKIAAVLMSYPDHSVFDSAYGAFFPRQVWALVYWDDVAVILVRRSLQNADWIRGHEFRWIQPDGNLAAMKQIVRGSPTAARGMGEDIARNLALHPDSVRAQTAAVAFQSLMPTP